MEEQNQQEVVSSTPAPTAPSSLVAIILFSITRRAPVLGAAEYHEPSISMAIGQTAPLPRPYNLVCRE
jgi:hypothetical protein